MSYFFFICHLILFFLALNLCAARSSTQISYTTSVEESIYSSKLEIYLSCNSSVSVGSKTISGTIGRLHPTGLCFKKNICAKTPVALV